MFQALSIRLRMGSGRGHKPSPTTVDGIAAGISAADELGMASAVAVAVAVLSGAGRVGAIRGVMSGM